MTRLKIPLLLSLVVFSNLLHGVINVYEYPETIVDGALGINKRSELYRVEVEQNGIRRNAYVMHDHNQEDHHRTLAKNPDHHWTNFSLSGKAKVIVSRLSGTPIRNSDTYPRKKGIVAQTNTAGQAVFEIDETQLPLQLWVDIDGPEDDVLLIFADPLEEDIPSNKDEEVAIILTSDSIETVRAKLNGPASVVAFEKGIHQWGNETDNTYKGYKLPIIDQKTIHIPGGAYIIGSFEAKGQGNWKIHGRGVVSACGKERLPSARSIPWSMVYSSNNAAKNQLIEGIISVCPPHFNLTLRGECVIDNVKMFGWWHQTDGTVTGDNSIVQNCFFKVMDDFIKVYSQNCLHVNNTMFHGINGAPFQFAWGRQHGDNNIMQDTYIVYSLPKQTKVINNTTLINVRSGKEGNITENNVWVGLYIDNGCNGLIGLNANGGIYRNFVLKNIELNSGMNPKPQNTRSYLIGGQFSDFVIENLIVDGHPIYGVNEEFDQPEHGKLWIEGESQAISFK